MCLLSSGGLYSHLILSPGYVLTILCWLNICWLWLVCADFAMFGIVPFLATFLCLILNIWLPDILTNRCHCFDKTDSKEKINFSLCRLTYKWRWIWCVLHVRFSQQFLRQKPLRLTFLRIVSHLVVLIAVFDVGPPIIAGNLSNQEKQNYLL